MYTTTNPKEPKRETTMILSYIQPKSLQLPTKDGSQSVGFRNEYSVWVMPILWQDVFLMLRE